MDAVARVLGRYGSLKVRHAESLGNAGGFSGARLWRVDTGEEQFCLRAWPREQNSERLHWMHRVLSHLQQTPFGELPFPVPTDSGETIVNDRGTLWELSRWLPGTANYHEQPSQTKLANAVGKLAQLHELLATCPGSSHPAEKSSTVQERLGVIEKLRREGRAQIGARLDRVAWPELRVRATDVLRRFDAQVDRVRAELLPYADRQWPIQVVIRDIWHDHMLFTGDRVTGIVDLGSLRLDTVAVDVARLVGSLARSPADWEIALAVYREVRIVSEVLEGLVGALDASFHALAGMSWLQWIYVEGRQFEDRSRVLARLDAILQGSCFPRRDA